MPVEFKRKISVYGESFWTFYNSQSLIIQDKIDWVIDLVRTLPVVPKKFFKHLEGTEGLYAIRVKMGNNIFRIFCFFDHDHLIILINGFQKKSEKLPRNQIEKALNLKKQYYDEEKKK